MVKYSKMHMNLILGRGALYNVNKISVRDLITDQSSSICFLSTLSNVEIGLP